MDFSCEECGKAFTTSRGLSSHRKAHKIVYTIKASKISSSSSKNKKKKKNIRDADAFSCNKCGRKFGSNSALGAHRRFCLTKKKSQNSKKNDNNGNNSSNISHSINKIRSKVHNSNNNITNINSTKKRNINDKVKNIVKNNLNHKQLLELLNKNYENMIQTTQLPMGKNVTRDINNYMQYICEALIIMDKEKNFMLSKPNNESLCLVDVLDKIEKGNYMIFEQFKTDIDMIFENNLKCSTSNNIMNHIHQMKSKFYIEWKHFMILFCLQLSNDKLKRNYQEMDMDNNNNINTFPPSKKRKLNNIIRITTENEIYDNNKINNFNVLNGSISELHEYEKILSNELNNLQKLMKQKKMILDNLPKLKQEKQYDDQMMLIKLKEMQENWRKESKEAMKKMDECYKQTQKEYDELKLKYGQIQNMEIERQQRIENVMNNFQHWNERDTIDFLGHVLNEHKRKTGCQNDHQKSLDQLKGLNIIGCTLQERSFKVILQLIHMSTVCQNAIFQAIQQLS